MNGQISPVDAIVQFHEYDKPFRARLPNTSGSYERAASIVIFGILVDVMVENNDTNRLLPPLIMGINDDGNTYHVTIDDVDNTLPNTVVNVTDNWNEYDAPTVNVYGDTTIVFVVLPIVHHMLRVVVVVIVLRIQISVGRVCAVSRECYGIPSNVIT